MRSHWCHNEGHVRDKHRENAAWRLELSRKPRNFQKSRNKPKNFWKMGERPRTDLPCPCRGSLAQPTAEFRRLISRTARQYIFVVLIHQFVFLFVWFYAALAN